MEQNQVAACPNCGKTDAKKITYTWWGGALGPRMFSHVKCNNCGAGYNSKTGKSNTVPITIYVVVTFVIAFFIFYYLAMSF
jgi:uncharacterized Zn finger protein